MVEAGLGLSCTSAVIRHAIPGGSVRTATANSYLENGARTMAGKSSLLGAQRSVRHRAVCKPSILNMQSRDYHESGLRDNPRDAGTSGLGQGRGDQ
jgi:hypothetical protein